MVSNFAGISILNKYATVFKIDKKSVCEMRVRLDLVVHHLFATLFQQSHCDEPYKTKMEGLMITESCLDMLRRCKLKFMKDGVHNLSKRLIGSI